MSDQDTPTPSGPTDWMRNNFQTRVQLGQLRPEAARKMWGHLDGGTRDGQDDQ